MLPTYSPSKRRAFARCVLRNALRVGRGDNVLIETWSATLPWAVSLTVEARALGARPLLSLKDEAAFWQSLTESPASQIGRVGDHEWAALKASDAYVYLYGPMDAAREEALPPAACRRAESNNHELMRLIQKYGVRTVRWDLGRTSELWAGRYGVDLARWRSELVDATMVDPSRLRGDGARLGERLLRGREVVISHPNGTHLTLRLDRRRPRVDDGVIDDEDVKAGNVIMILPTGVTSVTVSETQGEGTFVSNSTGVLYGREEEKPLPPGRWTLRNGTLTGFEAGAGGRHLRRDLAQMGNPRVRVGQLSVGLNPRISTIPLLFDQERGTITLEIGRNAQFGGRSRSPRLLAYMPLRGGSLEIDGQSVVDQGRLVGT